MDSSVGKLRDSADFEKYFTDYNQDGLPDVILIGKNLSSAFDKLIILQNHRTSYRLSLNTKNFTTDGHLLFDTLIDVDPHDNEFIIRTIENNSYASTIDYLIRFENNSFLIKQRVISSGYYTPDGRVYRFKCVYKDAFNLSQLDFDAAFSFNYGPDKGDTGTIARECTWRFVDE